MRNRRPALAPEHRTRQRLLPPLCKILREESGSSLIELALILGILGPPLLLGIADLGSVVYSSIEVSNAAHAGALYGMVSATYASDTTGIQQAAQAEAADFGANLTVTPTTYFACSSAIGGAQYTTQAAATSACTGASNHALQFVQVIATTTVTSRVHFSKLPSSFTLTGTSIMEVEE